MSVERRGGLAGGDRPSPPPIRPGSGEMFDRIAPRYDLLNRILSLGQDRRWRRRAIASLRLPPGGRMLDVATGTGDLALDALRRHGDLEVHGLDPSLEMLRLARAKGVEPGLRQRLILDPGAAENLPYESGTFDGAAIAFGIRNCVDRPRALREMARVTCPGGRLAVLELSEPERGPMAPMVRLYLHVGVPAVGGLISGKREYRYLQSSIEAFPPPSEFARMVESSGWTDVRVEKLTFGACLLVSATRNERTLPDETTARAPR